MRTRTDHERADARGFPGRSASDADVASTLRFSSPLPGRGAYDMSIAGVVEGRAVGPDGSPIARASILITTHESRARPATPSTTTPDGRYRVDGIPPGRYTVRIVTEDHGSLTGRVTVRASGTARLDFVLPG
jgi:Carboxypeptidase regulatory-like domain